MNVPHHDQVQAALQGLRTQVAQQQGRDEALLHGYLPALLEVAATGGRLGEAERAACRQTGAAAARSGVGLPALVDLYMTASRRLWPQLPRLVGLQRGRKVRSAELIELGEAIWRAADDALAALAAGHVEAQLLLVRSEEANRQQFVDDLLTGSGSVGALIERAEPFGLSLAGAHLVAVVRLAEQVTVSGRITDQVHEAARHRFGSTRDFLVTAKDGLLVCVLSADRTTDAGTADQLAQLVGTVAGDLSGGRPWLAAVSRANAGPLGIARCHAEARDALHVAESLDLRGPVVRAQELLVYRVLLRDEAALADLVAAVLGPLADARDGPERLLPTLHTYLSLAGNTAAAARALHLSVRAMSYRLQRIAKVTGFSPTVADDRLALHVAVVGARLLDWPRRPLLPHRQ